MATASAIKLADNWHGVGVGEEFVLKKRKERKDCFRMCCGEWVRRWEVTKKRGKAREMRSNIRKKLPIFLPLQNKPK